MARVFIWHAVAVWWCRTNDYFFTATRGNWWRKSVAQLISSFSRRLNWKLFFSLPCSQLCKSVLIMKTLVHSRKLNNERIVLISIVLKIRFDINVINLFFTYSSLLQVSEVFLHKQVNIHKTKRNQIKDNRDRSHTLVKSSFVWTKTARNRALHTFHVYCLIHLKVFIKSAGVWEYRTITLECYIWSEKRRKTNAQKYTNEKYRAHEIFCRCVDIVRANIYKSWHQTSERDQASASNLSVIWCNQATEIHIAGNHWIIGLCNYLKYVWRVK